MKNQKILISLTLIGLFAVNVASALPEFTKDAPQSSIDSCIAEVDSFAILDDATGVVHNVETRERRVSGHRMHIQTLVYGEGEELIREYAANCSINGQEEILRFRIHQKGE
jgi:hypothetical protein